MVKPICRHPLDFSVTITLSDKKSFFLLFLYIFYLTYTQTRGDNTKTVNFDKICVLGHVEYIFYFCLSIFLGGGGGGL